MENYFVLLRGFNEEVAKRFFYQFKDKILGIMDEHIFWASKFKLNNLKKRLSYADCSGYIMALNYNMKFLTGDKQFEKFENVEFVR